MPSPSSSPSTPLQSLNTLSSATSTATASTSPRRTHPYPTASSALAALRTRSAAHTQRPAPRLPHQALLLPARTHITDSHQLLPPRAVHARTPHHLARRRQAPVLIITALFVRAHCPTGNALFVCAHCPTGNEDMSVSLSLFSTATVSTASFAWLSCPTPPNKQLYRSAIQFMSS